MNAATEIIDEKRSTTVAVRRGMEVFTVVTGERDECAGVKWERERKKIETHLVHPDLCSKVVGFT